MSVYDDVLGSHPPVSPPEGQKDPKYSHWCNPEPGKEVGELSADRNAFAKGEAGMQGTENPFVPVEDRERGDAKAPGRENRPAESRPDWFTDQFKGE